MSEINIVKRDGTKMPLDLEKLHKVIFYACDDITGVSPSQVELNSHISFYDGIYFYQHLFLYRYTLRRISLLYQ